MNNNQPSRMRLTDILLLVVVASIGLLPGRLHLFGFLRNLWNPSVEHGRAYDVLLYSVQQLIPLLAVWTVGFLVMVVARAPGDARQLRDQPGFVACCVASLAILLGGSISMVALRLGPDGSEAVASAYIYRFLMPPEGNGSHANFSSETGFAVLAAWLALLLAGRWRAEPSWVDWLGRTLGLCWIATIPVLRLGYLFK
jgi:hypothetical protein